MEPIISNTGAPASEVNTSSAHTGIAAGLLQLQGKQRGKGAGKGQPGPADPAGLSTFAGMLQLASGNAAPGMAESFLPVGEHTGLAGKSPVKEGNRKVAVFAEGKAPVDGGMNLYALLQGLGLQKEQVEKIMREREGTLSHRAGASTEERGMAGEKIAALLRGYGLSDEKMQGLLSVLADGKFLAGRPLSGRQGVPQETGNVPGTAGRAGASGEAAPDSTAGKFSLLRDGLGTKEMPAEAAAIKTAPRGMGQELPRPPVDLPAAGRGMAPEGEGARDSASSRREGEGGNETRAAAMADAGGTALKQKGLFPLRDGTAAEETGQLNAALPLAEAGEGKDTAGGEKAPTVGKDAPSEGKEAGKVQRGAKQRPAAFKEQLAGVQQNREGRDGRPEETAATGKNGALPEVEMAGKKAGREDAGDRSMSLRGQGGAAGESAAAARVEQGNLFPASGAVPELRAETAPGLRPAMVIDQIAAQAGQFPQNSPGRIRITLNPPHLGTLDMDVLIRSNKVEVVMIASSQEVQQILKAHGDQLKNALQGQGFKMDGFDVMLQGNQAGPEYRFRDGNFTQDGRPEGGRGKGVEEASRPGIVSSPQGRDAEGGDGISVFV